MNLKIINVFVLMTLSFLAGCASREEQSVSAVASDCRHQEELPGKNTSYFVTSRSKEGDDSKKAFIQNGMGVAIKSLGDQCLLLTAKHTVSGAEAVWVQHWIGNTSEGAKEKSMVEARVIHEEPNADIALLTFSTPGGCPTVEPIMSSPPLGSDIFVYGQPIGGTGFVSSGIVSGSWETGRGPILVSDVFTTPGFSGSGAYNSSGQLVGLVSGKTVDERRGFAYIIPSPAITAVLTSIDGTSADYPQAYVKPTGRISPEQKKRINVKGRFPDKG